jgi:hypothetical protein
MPKDEMKEWKVGDRVKLRTMYPGTNGKRGKIERVDKWEVDVKVGNFTFLIHKSQLEEDDGRA